MCIVRPNIIKCPKCGEIKEISHLGDNFYQNHYGDLPSKFIDSYGCEKCHTTWEIIYKMSYIVENIELTDVIVDW